MATGQNVRRQATVSVAPLLLAGIVAMSLLVGSLLGVGAASLGASRGSQAAERATTSEAGAALIAVRAAERASAGADAIALRDRLGRSETALTAVRASERASEIPLAAVLARIRAEERAPLVP